MHEDVGEWVCMYMYEGRGVCICGVVHMCMHCCSATTQYPYTAIHTPSPRPLTDDLGTLPDPEGCGLSHPSHQYKPGTCTTVPPGHQNVHETPAHTIVTSTCVHAHTNSPSLSCPEMLPRVTVQVLS